MPRRKKTKPISKLQRVARKVEPILTPAREALHELLLFTGAMSGWHPMSIGEYEDRLRAQEIREKREWLKYLEERKWIQKKKIGEKLMVRLTAKGWQQALRDQIRCTATVCKDGVCILAIFDVPETERHVRDTLRWILSECGFMMLQKSVWISHKDVLKPLCALLQGAKLDKWVRIIMGKEIRQSLIKNVIIRAKAVRKAKAHPQ